MSTAHTTSQILSQLRTDAPVDFQHEDVEVQVRYNRLDRRFEIDARTEDGWLRPINEASSLRTATIVEQLLNTGAAS